MLQGTGNSLRRHVNFITWHLAEGWMFKGIWTINKNIAQTVQGMMRTNEFTDSERHYEDDVIEFTDSAKQYEDNINEFT